MKFIIISTARIAFFVLALMSQQVAAQSFDEERMRRDIEVAENVLATLIKQELEQDRTLFGLDVKGTYQPGYGVTFRVPADHSLPFVISFSPGDEVRDATIISDGNTYRYSYRVNGAPEPPPAGKPAGTGDDAVSLSQRKREKEESKIDSGRIEYQQRIIRAAQSFILDYGDFISQLKPEEKITVTNQNDRAHFYFPRGTKSRISVEGTRGDVTSFRQGKITRDQALRKLVVINTETVDKREPDLEMLSSIFTRLYRPDLSKTYFADGNVYYEHLRDVGAVFYMRVLSSNEIAPGRWHMPTVGLSNLDQSARDKKVAELYPEFEQDVKDNILEYGRTVKSLGADETLSFNIILTKCKGCGIPSTLELSIKASVLTDFGVGRIDKNTAMGKIQIKKSESQ